MSEEKTPQIPAWMHETVKEGEPLVIRSHAAVAMVMCIQDYNALVFLLGAAGAAGPAFLETALRLLRAFNPSGPAVEVTPGAAAPPGAMRPRASGGTEYP